MKSTLIAVSLGEPAGIGPDILINAAQTPRVSPWLVFGCARTLRERAAHLGLPLLLKPYQSDQLPSIEAGCLTYVDYPCATAVRLGHLQVANSTAVLEALTAAAKFCSAAPKRALVTLPIHKGVINASGIPFTGHTEWLADLSSVPKVVMMLGSDRLKVALQTIHVPLKAVPELITPAELTTTIAIMRDHWQTFYGKNPRILVLGLNPHAGEDGYLGLEEQEIMIPTLKSLRTAGYDVKGPVAADTAFNQDQLQGIDVVLAMYHDQGLAPLKALAFGEVVNYTLGLPYSRTSVDHGVALDVAGTGRAQMKSFSAAVHAAEKLLIS